MKRIDRRGFLRTGFTGAAGLAISPALVSAASPTQEKNISW